MPTVGMLNRKVLDGDISEMIKVAEAFHEKKIAAMADQIDEANRTLGARLTLNPTSS